MASSGSTSSPYNFAGDWAYQSNGDAGLQHVGARYYDPQVGRFASRDSMLDQIPYAYCGGEPNDFVDPSGGVRIAHARPVPYVIWLPLPDIEAPVWVPEFTPPQAEDWPGWEEPCGRARNDPSLPHCHPIDPGGDDPGVEAGDGGDMVPVPQDEPVGTRPEEHPMDDFTGEYPNGY
ncbi:MAG: hypothetical protein KGJ62_11910 [Armatimonadetes bacterium]|nr:hypothetical protein [Armatimonadota bacterium]MDE2206418.1 hypothetical protein [Armatimonadota bacterium]